MGNISLKTRIRRQIFKITGYEILKKVWAPIGYDLTNDLQNRLLIPMHTVFDVGANVGQTAMEILEDFPQAQVHSFEPIAATYELLLANTAAMPQVHCTHAALGAARETREISVNSQVASVTNSLNDWAMNEDPNAKKENILILTGDDVCKEKGIQSIDLLKIDTEGFELPVLQGFDQMLKAGKIKAIFCEATFNKDDKKHTYIGDLNDFVYGYGYVFYGLYDISNHSIKVGRNYVNVLYVSPETKENLIC